MVETGPDGTIVAFRETMELPPCSVDWKVGVEEVEKVRLAYTPQA
jgi:hypothetical protein